MCYIYVRSCWSPSAAEKFARFRGDRHVLRAKVLDAGGSVAGATSIKEAAKLTGFVVTYALHGYLHKTGAYRCRVSGGSLPFVFVALSASKKLSHGGFRGLKCIRPSRVRVARICVSVALSTSRPPARISRNAI